PAAAQVTLLRARLDDQRLEIVHEDQHVAAVRGKAFAHALERMALGREGQRGDRAFAERVGDGDVAVRLQRAGRRDRDRIARFRGDALVDEVGPVAEVAEYAPAFLLLEIPVVLIDRVTGD